MEPALASSWANHQLIDLPAMNMENKRYETAHRSYASQMKPRTILGPRNWSDLDIDGSSELGKRQTFVDLDDLVNIKRRHVFNSDEDMPELSSPSSTSSVSSTFSSRQSPPAQPKPRTRPPSKRTPSAKVMENRQNELTRSTRTTRSSTKRERRLSSRQTDHDDDEESACASFATPNLTEFTDAQTPPPRAQLFQTCDTLWHGKNGISTEDSMLDINAVGKKLRFKLHQASQRILETKSSARTLPMSMRLRKGDGSSSAVGGSKNFFTRSRVIDRMHQRQRAIEKIKKYLDFVTDEDLQCFQRLSEQDHQVDITTQYTCATCHKCYKNSRGLAYHLERCRGANGQPNYEEDEEDDPNAIIRCICARPTDSTGSMVQCDRCEIWLHMDCIGQSEDALDDQYFCPRCAGHYRSPSPTYHTGGGKSVDLLVQARNLELAKSRARVILKKQTRKSSRSSRHAPSLQQHRKALINWRQEAVRKDQMLQQKKLQRVLRLSRSTSMSSLDADSDLADDDDNASYLSDQNVEEWQDITDSRTLFVSDSWSNDDPPSLLFDQGSLSSSPIDEDHVLDLSTSSSQMVIQLPSECQPNNIEHLFDIDSPMDENTVFIPAFNGGDWTSSDNVSPYLFPHQNRLKLVDQSFETYPSVSSTPHDEAIDLWLSTGGGGDVVVGVDMDQELDGLVDLDM
ncbi:hypothetical protein INT43_005463 [Umbelopsis isabellina]|uniref:PHD-type domain-containing protein n=1 Tax=Mortierella isabellina TaxID=91625 RepID=A0A8H7UE87_MORIS|nr:hypothetical protein INT43_005463 [Umbelopsis isabellina]